MKSVLFILGKCLYLSYPWFFFFLLPIIHEQHCLVYLVFNLTGCIWAKYDEIRWSRFRENRYFVFVTYVSYSKFRVIEQNWKKVSIHSQTCSIQNLINGPHICGCIDIIYGMIALKHTHKHTHNCRHFSVFQLMFLSMIRVLCEHTIVLYTKVYVNILSSI